VPCHWSFGPADGVSRNAKGKGPMTNDKGPTTSKGDNPVRINCNPAEHVNRRAFLKGTLATAGGAALANFGSLFDSPSIAAEVKKKAKRCILLWMDGGASQLETFDMKPGTEHGGPFRPIDTRVPGMQICEYLPKLAQQADKLAVIRSMKTAEGDHVRAITLMH